MVFRSRTSSFSMSVFCLLLHEALRALDAGIAVWREEKGCERQELNHAVERTPGLGAMNRNLIYGVMHRRRAGT